MPSADTSIRTVLLATSSVTDAVASGPHGVASIFCGVSPQGATQPRIEIETDNTDPMLTLGATSGMRMDDVTIVCKAYGRDDASGLADAVEAALNDYSGTPSGGVTIHAMILTDRYHQAEATDTGTDKRLFLTILEYQVQHS